MYNVTKYYKGDPYWLNAKHPSVCAACGKPINIGDEAFYYPRAKKLYCKKNGCGDRAYIDFMTMAEAEEYYGSGGRYRMETQQPDRIGGKDKYKGLLLLNVVIKRIITRMTGQELPHNTWVNAMDYSLWQRVSTSRGNKMERLPIPQEVVASAFVEYNQWSQIRANKLEGYNYKQTGEVKSMHYLPMTRRRVEGQPYSPYNKDLFKRIAQSAGLSPTDASRFIKFAMSWWGNKSSYDTAYVSEWAGRFKKGTEYAMSDDERLALLWNVDANAASRYYYTLLQYGWQPDKALTEATRINNQMKPKQRKTQRKPARKATTKKKTTAPKKKPATRPQIKPRRKQ